MDNELKHYGVKGMKWGVRRASRRRSPSEDHVRAKELKKKKLSQLSNAELRELNNRMNLESQYKNLKRQNVSAGRKFVQEVAREAAKNTASDYARRYAKEGANFIATNISSRSYMKRNGHS